MKAKKILSYVMAGTMAATFVTSVQFTYAAEAVYEEGVIERIDFENYDEGTVINSNKTFKNGTMMVEGTRTDTNKLEVVKDKVTGSKALKMTKDNTETQLNMWYQLKSPKTTGAYKVSFDLRIESASTSFPNLGALQNASWGNIVKPMIRGSVGLYNNGSEWWGNYQTLFGNTNVKYEYIVDLESKKVTVTITNGTNKVNKSYNFTQDNIEKLFFSMKSPAADADCKGWDYVAENNPDGVMYIDNITFEEYDTSIISEINFDNFSEGTNFSESNWDTKKYDGDSIIVETDPVSGSKALKLTKGSTEESMYAEYGIPSTVTSGKIIVEYDARIAVATKYFDKIGEIRNSNWSSVFSPRVKQNGLFNGDDDLNFNYKDNIGYNYAKFQYIWDIDHSTVTFNIYSNDGVKLVGTSKKYGKDPNDFKYINFLISTDNTYNVNAWDCIYANDGTKNTAENNPDGVLYIDNLKISNYTFKASGASVEDGEENVPRDRKLVINYNGVAADDALTKDNFKLYENGELMTDYTVEKTEDGTGVVLTPEEGLLYGVTYKIEAAAGVADTDGLKTLKGFTRTFTVEKYEDSEVLASWDFEGYEEGTLKSSSSLPVTVANGDTVEIRKDSYGSKALYIERAEDNLSTKKETTLKFMLNEPVSSGTIKITQSFRAENYRAGISQLFSVTNSAWSSTDRSYFHGGYYYPQIGGTYGYEMDRVESTKYLTVEKYINLDTGAYDIYYYIDGVEKYKGENQKVSPKTVEYLLLTVAKDEWYDIYGESGNAKYYFDNIKIELLKTPDIIWTSPVNGADNVALNREVILSAGAVLDKSTVTKENIVVTKNGENVSDYSVSVADDKNIKITFANGMEKASNYEINVSGLKTYGSGYEMSKSFSMSYTTADEFSLEFSKIAKDPADNTKFNITYELSNSSIKGGIDLVFASYDKDGKLLGAVAEKVDAAIGDMAYGEVTLPVGTKVLCYVWNGFEEMIPVCSPVEISVPEDTTYGIDVINGEGDITIAFIGGSITEQQQWITPLKTYFNEKFEGRTVNYIVAGVGGTGSALQQYRVYNDVISKSPDLVIVDSTINDSAVSESCEKTYENTIRQLMKAKHQPAVLAVAFGNSESAASDSWEEAYNKQAAINDYYGIAYINVQGYADEQVAAGNYVWKADGSGKTAITADGTHPNADGGALYANYIKSVLESDFGGFIKKMTPRSEYMHEGAKVFANAREISWKNASFAGSWKIGATSPTKFHEGTVETSEDGSSVTVTFYGKAISIYNYGGASGMYIDYVLDDGAKEGRISSFVNSWDFNQAGSTQAITADEIGTHTITFTARGTNVESAALVIGYFLVY